MTSPPDDTATDPAGVAVDDGDVMDADWMQDERPRTGTLTKVLAGLLLVALGFLGGVAVERSAGGAALAGGSTSGSTGGGGGGGGAATGGGSTGGGTGTGTGNSGAGNSAAPSAANGPGVEGPRTSVGAPPTVVVTGAQQPAPVRSPATANVGSVGGLAPTVGVQPTATVNGGARAGSTPATVVNGTG